MPSKDGGEPIVWETLEPSRLWCELIASSPRLSALIAVAIGERPPSPTSPWHLIIAFDEFAPGNKLNVNNSRTSQRRCSISRSLRRTPLPFGSSPRPRRMRPTEAD